MAIVNTNTPITAQRTNEMILQLVQTYPELRSEVLTTSAFGREIRTLTMGTGERQVLFTAAHHANEWITALVLLKFTEDLAQAASVNGRIYGIEARTILKAATIHMVPLVDPDGVDLVVGAIAPGTLEYETARGFADNYPNIPFPNGWKANLLGVDLNLQYPALWLRAREIKFSQGFTRPGPRDYVGRAPLNQLESRALAELTEELDPALVLAYHTQGKVIYWQFQDIPVPSARALAEEFARLSGYALEEVPEESSYAGYKDWFIQSFRRPGFTIEVGSGNNPLPLSQFDEIYRDNLGILTTAALGLRETT
jgi:g-D-glutamyl-meso-diaminopimelate peptidase